MKLLTAAIPCYNSAAYMGHAIDTLLTGGEEIEIIIVNDGSSDDTLKIAEEYRQRHPSIIKVISQENGGHGEAVNTGLANAQGLYFKVVDSDDWVNEKALLQVMERLKNLIADGNSPDLFLANYVYEKVDAKKKKVINYNWALPKEQIFTWDEIMHFKQSQNILMHSTIYRTKLLKDCGIVLPKHTFYVDNIFVYQPLPFVKTLYYMDVNLYRYFIGRADQSVNEQIMIKRIDQQLKITKIMIESHNLMQIKSKKLQNYMIKYLSMMMAICSVFLIKEGSDESIAKKQDLWDYLKNYDKWLYKKIRSQILGRSMNLPGKFGRRVVEVGYNITRRIYGFN
ncbi:glycosyltransferase family 2 protein [Mobilitalea sibirica]|uniref:Glycosyltransferase family 2 protein n=1 Tax=Mobilitalea sibirica TaxID=1462919 RepID=A0A8J7KWN9_9FIRM|nr:glycosyltransferase family A protein [Mobilitalea sibirica]MBH1940722.1 glycosyltransferase family 2 protein [Mobilitalea sibirica]